MTPCKHESLKYVGDQKTDDGVNSYYQCNSCGTLLVVMPSSKVIGIPGIQPAVPSTEEGNTS